VSEELFPKPRPDESAIPSAQAYKPSVDEVQLDIEAERRDYQLHNTSAGDASVDATYPVDVEDGIPIEPIPPVKPAKPPKSFWREVLETVILTILIFFLAESLIQPFRIQGSSMDPTFHTDQLLMVNKAAYFHFDINPWLRILPWAKAEGSHTFWLFGGPQRGDVVVFEYPRDPSQDYIKRVIGLPGETVEVKSGVVYVDNKPLNEPYIKEPPFSAYGPVKVPQDSLFVMGDNRNGSSDSRAWGFLPIDRVIGKAMIVYWPFGNGWGIVSTPSYK